MEENIKVIWKVTTITVAMFGTIALLSYESLLTFVLSLLFGYITELVARKKGLYSNYSFLYGYTWGLLALLYYIVSEKEKDEDKDKIRTR